MSARRSPDPAVEAVARDAYGRLVALLARRSGDLALAEDAVSHALVQALERWPVSGTPDDPEGWLYTVARRALVGSWRKQEVRRRKAAALRQLAELVPPTQGGEGAADGDAASPGGAGWPDERLPLLFVCAHPAIDPEVRAPLMLRTVLGLTAEEIAPLFGLAPKTMGQRLWRATTKIKRARIPFEVPDPGELRGRVAAVLDAIYGLYGAGWSTVPGVFEEGRTGEAAALARVVTVVLPGEAEALGLHALLLYAESRRGAGRDASGRYVPLDAQDPGDWNEALWREADERLAESARLGDIGPFQLEAAIQSAVVHGRRRGAVDQRAVRDLYQALVHLAPTLGARCGHAAAVAAVDGPEAGLEILDDLAAGEPRAAHYQPWWAVRADLLARAHLAGGAATASAAREAYERALALTDDPAVAAFLTGALSSLVSRTGVPSRGTSPGDGGASSGRPPCGSR
jgi:RNA polymerase sigma-70 factor (ECF subfamily)